ncbi:S-type anion channel SLAH1-like, partial [Magnolia sinica]|uniref:S-type anion channel SLAH1-like n=1 Tax=Magnolia sinica TaxID=86752 RepID=UPI002659DD4D
ILMRIDAGHFRISLSLCSQALLWKTLREPSDDMHAIHHLISKLPSTAFIIFWSASLFVLLSLFLLYILRCFFHFHMVKAEFLDHIKVNYLFAPSISWILLLQSSPFIHPKSTYYVVLWWVFMVPILALDVKIYGQWFTKGTFLSMVANPTSHISVIGNLVGARAAAQMGWKECAMCIFSIGIIHYLVLFVTLYQGFSGSDRLPVKLRPVFFLFFAAPSTASLAWDSISGTFGTPSKMLFFLSMFLFASPGTRPALFKKSMRKFHVAWWAYPFPLTVLALASAQYAEEVKGALAHLLMLVLSGLSIIVCMGVVIFTLLNVGLFLRQHFSYIHAAA